MDRKACRGCSAITPRLLLAEEISHASPLLLALCLLPVSAFAQSGPPLRLQGSVAVERLNRCENIVALSQELGVSRRLLYTWREKLEPR